MRATFSAPVLRRRMARVRVLLETHDEPYDVELNRQERMTISGFTEPFTRSYTCGSCAGGGCQRCENGKVSLQERDPYDTGAKGFTPLEKTMSQRQIERELEAIRETELQREGVIADIEFEVALERAEARDRRGSYEALRVAMDFMPTHLRGDAAVQWLAENLPGTIRIPRWAFEREVDEIEREVVELRDAGLNASEIADALAISKRQVRTALRRARPAA